MKDLSLKALRVNAELNQKQAAQAVDVNPATIISWEAGKTFPTALQLELLCEVYHCTKDDIRVPKKLTIS